MEGKREESKELPSNDGTGSSCDESGSSDENDSLIRDAFRFLECGETTSYLMITPRDLSTTRGVKKELENVSTEDSKHISRIEGEIDARYSVERAFVEALLTNSEMRLGLERMHEEKTSYQSESSNMLIQFLNCAFENRYDHLYSVFFWTRYRWEYLALVSEHQALIEYFDEEYERCLGSIPPNKAAFAKWIKLIKQVKTKMEEFKKEKGFGDVEEEVEQALSVADATVTHEGKVAVAAGNDEDSDERKIPWAPTALQSHSSEGSVIMAISGEGAPPSDVKKMPAPPPLHQQSSEESVPQHEESQLSIVTTSTYHPSPRKKQGTGNKESEN